MNHQIPSVDQFLASSEPDEDDTPDLTIGPGMLWQVPPDPMERVATALESIAEHFTADKQPGGSTFEPVEGAPVMVEAEALQLSYEKLADAEDQLKTMADVLANVEAALGKSKAAPALAAKSVIEAWRNPTVSVEEPEPTIEDEIDAAYDQPDDEQPDLPSLADTDEMNESVPGHTRTPHPDGPDFCRECSGERQEWVVWPCESAVPSPQQPAHNAPVEEWRAYARALGYAGPEIDKANRSMIRTTLGVVQPTEGS